MNNNPSLPEMPSIPTEYQILIEPARKIGNLLGDLIADGWDNLIDKVFSTPDKKK